MLKDVSSKDPDWIRDLRIILIVAQKDSLVHYALRLRIGAAKHFERHGAYEMFQELKLVFQIHARVERYETSDKYFAYKMEENSSTSEHVAQIV